MTTTGEKTGYTLIELVVSMAIASVLMLGMASTLLVAFRMSTPPTQVKSVLESSRAAFELTDELRYAILITERSDRLIQFAVADRDGDGREDVIRYEWSGTAGDPLTRSFNFGAPHPVVTEVQEFDLTWDIREQEESISNVEESTEQVLASVTGGGARSDQSIQYNAWRGQYFRPSLPGDALHWKVTQAQLYLRQSGLPTGQVKIQLRPATGSNTPASTVMEEVLLDESTLIGSYRWTTFSYNRVTEVPPEQGLCLVMKHVSGGESCEVAYEGEEVSLPNSGLLASNNQGASWTIETEKGLHFKVLGTFTTPVSPLNVNRKYLTGVGIRLRSGEDPRSTINTRTPLLNTPELLSTFWELDFDRDPTAVDANFDNTSDWATSIGTFDVAQLANGIWSANSADGMLLHTRPDHDFSELTTAVIQCRNTSVGGLGARFWLNVDHNGDTSGVIYTSVTLQGDGTQTARIYTKPDPSTDILLVTVPRLSQDFVQIRLVVIPNSDRVAVWVDGMFIGTYIYTPFDHNESHFCHVTADGSDAEFDYVSLRVAEST